jgi:hypothetical protein
MTETRLNKNHAQPGFPGTEMLRNVIDYHRKSVASFLVYRSHQILVLALFFLLITSKMSLLYQTYDEITQCTTSCFEVGNYVSAWVEYGPQYYKFTLGHHKSRFGTGLEDARIKGVSWTTDIMDLVRTMEKRGKLEWAVSQCNQEEHSSGIMKVGADKDMKIIYHHQYALKVEFSQGQNWVRMPKTIFVKLYNHLLDNHMFTLPPAIAK